jgi:glc operon protein GlcG
MNIMPTIVMPPKVPMRNALPIDAARRAIDAALTRAAELNVAVTVAIVDDGGHMIAQARADGCPIAAIDSSRVKAQTCVRFGSATADMPSEPARVSLMSAASAEPVAMIAGGLPLTGDGVLIGAVGVAGSAPDVDLQVATAASEAL